MAHTLDVRLGHGRGRADDGGDLGRVLGADLASRLNVNEVVEGLIVFENEEYAEIYRDLGNSTAGGGFDIADIVCIDGRDAANAMAESKGVMVIVDDPVVPAYLREKLLSIAYQI